MAYRLFPLAQSARAIFGSRKRRQTYSGSARPITAGDIQNIVPLGGLLGFGRSAGKFAGRRFLGIVRNPMGALKKNIALKLGLVGAGVAAGFGINPLSLLNPFNLFAPYRLGKNIAGKSRDVIPQDAAMTPFPGGSPFGMSIASPADLRPSARDGFVGRAAERFQSPEGIIPSVNITGGGGTLPAINVFGGGSGSDLAQLAALLGIPLAVLLAYLGIKRRKKKKRKIKKKRTR